MICALFWNITQCRVIISYECAWTAYQSHLHGSKVMNYHSPLPIMPEGLGSYPLWPALEITDRNMRALVEDIIVFGFMYGWFYKAGESVLTRHLLVRILGIMCGEITTFLFEETKCLSDHKPHSWQKCLIVRKVWKDICKGQQWRSMVCSRLGLVFYYFDTYLVVLICENTNSKKYSVSSETGFDLISMQNGSCVVSTFSGWIVQ
jgi:hypothetical protein